MTSSSSSQGETSLTRLLKSMNPTLSPTSYVFATIPLDDSPKLAHFLSPSLAGAMPKMLFQENEAWTLILSKVSAAEEGGLEYAFQCRQITLNVHSSLDAVGFLAVITTKLASNLEIGVNPVSGYYHDHLFVPEGQEEKVMEELRKIAREA